MKIQVADLDQKDVFMEKLQTNKANALVFFSPECPLSENYTLTMNDMQEKFKGDSIGFYIVFAGKTYSKEEINTFITEYKVEQGILLDEQYKLTQNLEASITPEVFLLNRSGDIIYSGQIDNWAFSLGKQRRKVTEHYLIDAVQATIDGNEILVKKTNAVGCIIE